jgi:hypothetical protein
VVRQPQIHAIPNQHAAENNIYPVPAEGAVNIDITGLEEIKMIWFTDLTGKRMHVTDITQNKNVITVPVHNFPPGLYFVHLDTGAETISKKIQVRQ